MFSYKNPYPLANVAGFLFIYDNFAPDSDPVMTIRNQSVNHPIELYDP